MNQTRDPRDQLRFVACVRDAFQYLETQYGMLCTYQDVTCVRYDTTDVRVLVSHGQTSYEIRVEADLKSGDRDLSMYELSSIMGVRGRLGWTTWQASTPDSVAAGVAHLAGLLRAHGDRCLRGEKAAFEEMKSRRLERVRSYEIETKLEHARSRAEAAWQRKDYSSYWAELAPLEDHLNDLERKRLSYSRRHIP
jgi:hypothetical protein